MTQDWEDVKVLAHELGNSKWEYRALAQLGIAAYQEGNVQIAITDVGMAVTAATAANDSGALIRFFTLIGQGHADSGKYAQALPYLENSLKLAAVTPEAGYRFLTNEVKTKTLIGLGQLDNAKHLADEIRTRAAQSGRREHEAIALHWLGRIGDISQDITGVVSNK